MSRLEDVFEALSDLPFQPDVRAALELACEVLAAELPCEGLAAGLHDIDADAIRFVVARGEVLPSLRSAPMPRARCLIDYAAEQAVVVHGGQDGASWIGGNGAESTVLLCPILHDGTLCGLLALADPLCAAEWSRYDLELVRYVADQLAAFIHEHSQRPGVAIETAPRRSVQP